MKEKLEPSISQRKGRGEDHVYKEKNTEVWQAAEKPFQDMKTSGLEFGDSGGAVDFSGFKARPVQSGRRAMTTQHAAVLGTRACRLTPKSVFQAAW